MNMIKHVGMLVMAVALTGAGFAAEKKITLVSPKDGAQVSLLTERQRTYLSTPTDKRVIGFDDPFTRAGLATIGWTPAPVVLVWDGADWSAPSATIEVRRERDDKVVIKEDISYRTRNVYEAKNLETGTAYKWQATVDGVASEWGRFVTEPGPRLVEVDGVPNFRDVGGRIGYGGKRVKQGLLYRCSGANRNATEKECPGIDRITEKGRVTARAVLGIKTELDLRNDKETRGMHSSPFGVGVKWVNISFGCYQWIDKDPERKAVADAFRLCNDTNNLPIAFHCISGQDRTGTLAFILNALLGVQESELSLDWEMTIFWNPATGWFSRKNRYEAMLKYFNDNFAGATLNEKVEAYVLSCGVKHEEIEHFRKMMLD